MNKFYFGFILFCFIASFCYRRYSIGRVDAYLLRGAMFLTCAADFFMLIVGNEMLGLVFFILVQLVYCVRYSGLKIRWSVAQAACTAAAIITAFTVMSASGAAREVLTPLLCVGIGYGVCFVFTLILVWKNMKRYKMLGRILTTSGMTLFALCDINVGLQAILDNPQALRIVGVLIWVFYLPGQFILSQSAARWGKLS